MRYAKLDLWDASSNKFTIKVPYLGYVSDYSSSYTRVNAGLSNLTGIGGETVDMSGGENIMSSTFNGNWYIDPSMSRGFTISTSGGSSQYRGIEGFTQASQSAKPKLLGQKTGAPITTDLQLGIITNGTRNTFCFVCTGTLGSTSAVNIGYGHNVLNTLYDAAYHNVDPFDPFSPGGYSDESDTNSNFSEDSDTLTDDPLPDETSIGCTAVGLVTLFSPTKNQLKYLADIIWGNGFFQFMQNIVENIADLFISLTMLPFTVDKGNTVEVTWFDFAISGQTVGTGIYLDLAASQFVEIDMGTIDMSNDQYIFTSGSVLDYSPYSKLGIYLPFIGYQELDVDECRNATINLKYKIDILSGTCVAKVFVAGKPIYQFTGNCATQLPLTSVDAQSMLTNAVNIGIAAAGAGASGAVASAGDAFTAEKLANGDISAAGAELQNSQHASMVSGAQGSLAAATANGIMGMKPNFKKSGAISASASMISVKQPYLFLTTPRQSYPKNYAHYCGFPCNITGKLGDFTGFTVVEDIRLNGLVATSAEVEEIYQLLKRGVII